MVLFLLLLGVASLKSSRDLEASRGREALLENRIHETEARIERLHARIDRLRKDPGALERHAREDLGMVRPGDLVIIVPDGPPGADTPRPAPRSEPLVPAPTPVPPPAATPPVATPVTASSPAPAASAPL
ncbi:MAG TPA: septum formation initiator family protein [Thermoanaerobaculia bacterium]|nr:septum formation initiator family protein [Thermoanaerobaculia bacterium]